MVAWSYYIRPGSKASTDIKLMLVKVFPMMKVFPMTNVLSVSLVYNLSQRLCRTGEHPLIIYFY